MFTKILYPTDFSDVAEKALDYIKQLKEAGTQEVIILHVVNQHIIDGLLRHGMLELDIEGWRTKAKEVGQEALAEMRRKLESIGFTIQTVIKTGYPANVILDMETREAPSIIVIGSHGRTNLSNIVLGSVSRRVIRKCKGPVMVVKRDAED
jgi:nucleotide-binding universal stress UspA family protein